MNCPNCKIEVIENKNPYSKKQIVEARKFGTPLPASNTYFDIEDGEIIFRKFNCCNTVQSLVGANG